MEELDWQLADLSGRTLADLRADSEALAEDKQELTGQVERARTNIGTGPPGRAD